MYFIVENHFECDGWNGFTFSKDLKRDGTWKNNASKDEIMSFETEEEASRYLRTLKKPREDSKMFVMKWRPYFEEE